MRAAKTLFLQNDPFLEMACFSGSENVAYSDQVFGMLKGARGVYVPHE
jgi:hypothetical protein